MDCVLGLAERRPTQHGFLRAQARFPQHTHTDTERETHTQTHTHFLLRLGLCGRTVHYGLYVHAPRRQGHCIYSPISGS